MSAISILMKYSCKVFMLYQRVYYVKILNTIKTCIVVFRFSRKISGLRIDRYQSAKLICLSSLIKHLLVIFSFTSLYN